MAYEKSDVDLGESYHPAEDVLDGEAGPTTVDRTDLAILEALAADGRASQREVARTIGMSPPAVAERLARMERQGVIVGYGVRVDWSRLGFGLTAYVHVEMTEPMQLTEALLANLERMPEVEDALQVTGPKDLLVRLLLRDHRHLRHTLRRIWRLEGVQRTETLISLSPLTTKPFDLHMLRSVRAGLDQAATDGAS